MKRAKKYNLHICISLSRVTPDQTGKAIGVLFRRYLSPRLAVCTIERANDADVSRRAETVIKQLLGRPTPWGPSTPPEMKTVLLDDDKVRQLAKCWDSGVAECTIVVPHIFYRSLLGCALRNLELRAPEMRSSVCIIFDYPVLDLLPEIVRQGFFGERASVLAHSRKTGLSFIDPGRQLYLENLISLACYTLPAKHLVFMDDDFFVSHESSIEALLAPLRRGYLMSGRYARGADRIHTSFFALKPECLRDELLLFDDGKNLYANESMSTGTITYRRLSGREQGVCILGDYRDADASLGRHLCHCTGELWNDLPHILRALFRSDALPPGGGRRKLDVSMLLEALALLFEVRRDADNDAYLHIDNELRRNAVNDFAAYFGKIYHNHHWLERHAASLMLDGAAWGTPGDR